MGTHVQGMEGGGGEGRGRVEAGLTFRIWHNEEVLHFRGESSAASILLRWQGVSKTVAPCPVVQISPGRSQRPATAVVGTFYPPASFNVYTSQTSSQAFSNPSCFQPTDEMAYVIAVGEKWSRAHVFLGVAGSPPHRLPVIGVCHGPAQRDHGQKGPPSQP